MRMWLMYLLEMCNGTECSPEGGGGECVGWSVRNANALSAVWRICRVGDQSKLLDELRSLNVGTSAPKLCARISALEGEQC